MPTPLVSVVMTSYNREHYIAQAIDSVLAQECNFPFEIIIGDDFSTDNSRQLLQSYHDQHPDIVVLNLQPTNQGFGRNWASTCKLAQGRYVAFLDDDDYWCDNNRLQEMVDFLETHNDYGLVYTNRYIYEVEKDVKYPANTCLPEGADMVQYMNTSGFPILFSTTMIRKLVLDKHVNFEDYIKYNFPIQDWPTAMLIAPFCKFKYFNKPSVVYRSYSGSMSKPKEYEQILKKYGKEKPMYKYVQEQLGLNFDEAGWDRYVNHLLMSLAYQRREFEMARKYAILYGEHTLKADCAKHRFTFWLFIYAKNCKNGIKEILHRK